MVKQVLVSLVFLSCIFISPNLLAQDWWSQYSKHDREEILFEKAKQAVLKRGDERYFTNRSGYKIDSSFFKGLMPKLYRKEVYEIYFLYDNTRMRHIEKYLAKVCVLKETGEVAILGFGNSQAAHPNGVNKVEYKELEKWEIETMSFLSVFINGGIDIFRMAPDNIMLLPPLKVEIKDLIVLYGEANLKSSDDNIYKFPVIDTKGEECVQWLTKAKDEGIPVLLLLVDGRENEIGQVKPLTREARIHFEARSKQK